jgi:DNA-binding MarR family transcriptional regulator
MVPDSSSSVLAEATDSEAKAAIVLGLLQAVHNNNAVTQRSLARELGIALGIANATLRRCVEKGLIKVRQAPARRYAYYLTPRGFTEKSRLTAQYLTYSFQFFRDARKQCEALLGECAGRGWHRIALAGGGELAEIVRLCVLDSGAELIGLVDANEAAQRFGGMPVVAVLGELAADRIDVVIITDVRTPQATFDAIRAAAPALGLVPERIVAPELLRISPTPLVVAPDDDGIPC